MKSIILIERLIANATVSHGMILIGCSFYIKDFVERVLNIFAGLKF